MNTHADKTQENKNQLVANSVSQKQSGGESTFQFVDNRTEAVAQRKLQEIANNSPQVSQLRAFQEMANNSPQAKQAAQLQAMANNHSAQQPQPIQKKENNTGLPDNLKSGIENLSGYSMDDVKVHSNSDKPAQLQAHAYAQGTDIHIVSGQEKHLPHEAWHVVQQKQGRVKPTMQMKGSVNVNDDAGLEQEADVMGAKALKMTSADTSLASAKLQKEGLVQRMQMKDRTSEVVQLLAKAGDTIELEVKPVEPPRFMQNKGEPGGGEEPKSGEIGGTGILDAGSWGTLGVSPRDFHRAHAISNAFGGGGGANNVAWWSSAKEVEWTASEEKVRGGGLDQVPAWKPGDVEKGDYTVTRETKDNIDFKPGYLSKINAAAAWGLNDSRAAWTRFEALVGDPSTELTKGTQLKTAYLASLNNYFSKKLDDLGYKKAGENLIKKMNMDYSIATTGTGAGGSRANLAKEVVADDVDAATFGLKNEPENIWKAMVAATDGLFSGNWLATGNKRVNRPWGGPSSGVPRPAPIELTPHDDGWGIA